MIMIVVRMIRVMIITRLSTHEEALSLVDDLFPKEEIVHVPMNIQQEEIVHEPMNIQQEEIVHVPMTQPIHRVGDILPIAPKERDFYLTMHLRTLPSNRHGFFLEYS